MKKNEFVFSDTSKERRYFNTGFVYGTSKLDVSLGIVDGPV